MQTFLSEPTWQKSIEALDNARLNKQILEVRQILSALAGQTKGWVNHPATNMWRGYEWGLGAYGGLCYAELGIRGINADKNMDAITALMSNFYESSTEVPWWWERSETKDKILVTHAAMLYKKDSAHYSDYRHDATFYDKMLAVSPEGVVCCAARRRVPGMSGLQPCQYYWPSHKENNV
jgi:hypothetical protein